MKFTSYLAAGQYCVKRGIDLSRIQRRSPYDFRIARAS